MNSDLTSNQKNTPLRIRKNSIPFGLSFCSLLVGFGIFMTGRHAFAAEAVTIKNPGFESSEGNSLLEWDTHTDPAHADSAKGVATVATFTRVTEGAQEGTACALIAHEGPRWATIRQTVDLPDPGTYRLRAFLKTDPNQSSTRIRANLRLSSGSKSKTTDIIKPAQNNDDKPFELNSKGEWVEFSKDFIVTELPSSPKPRLEVRFIAMGEVKEPQKIFVDNISLERIQ